MNPTKASKALFAFVIFSWAAGLRAGAGDVTDNKGLTGKPDPAFLRVFKLLKAADLPVSYAVIPALAGAGLAAFFRGEAAGGLERQLARPVARRPVVCVEGRGGQRILLGLHLLRHGDDHPLSEWRHLEQSEQHQRGHH